MALMSDLKTAADMQFNSATKLARAARELNAIRKDLLAEGSLDRADAIRRVIEEILREGENLSGNAKRSSQGLVRALRSPW